MSRKKYMGQLTFAAVLMASSAIKIEASCVFHQDSATVCTTAFGETTCSTTVYYDLICAGGGTGGTGGGGGGGGSGSNLTSTQLYALEGGMTLARDRLQVMASCMGMYSELQLNPTNGLSILMNTEYIDGTSTPQCQQHPNAMWTYVNSTTVRVCHGVPNLRPADVAMLMLHESLHTVGQLESPATPGAPSSSDISGYVRTRCNLN